MTSPTFSKEVPTVAGDYWCKLKEPCDQPFECFAVEPGSDALASDSLGVIHVSEVEWFYGPLPVEMGQPDDTSAEVAFARMCCAYKSFEHEHDGPVHALYKRMCDGERTPELVAAMEALTAKMNQPTKGPRR